MESMKLEQELILNKILSQSTFYDYGWADLKTPLSMEFYQSWIQQGLYADMEYLKEHMPMKKDPQSLHSHIKSSIVVTQNYFKHPRPLELNKTSNLLTARYARGEDYHFWFKKKLKNLCEKLKEEFKDHDFHPYSDSGPVLERDLAYRSGLGWIGKNTCLIHTKKGSFFFIGEIYTSLNLKESSVYHPDRCGKCTRCMDACPTQALIKPRQLDANKCISYWNIEAKTIAPKKIRESIGNLFFGCDICQDVCPWNKKVFGPIEKPKGNIVSELLFILSSSNKTLQKHFKLSPLLRARPNGLKRNAIIVSGNLKLKDLKEVIQTYKEKPYFKELVSWYEAQL